MRNASLVLGRRRSKSCIKVRTKYILVILHDKLDVCFSRSCVFLDHFVAVPIVVMARRDDSITPCAAVAVDDQAQLHDILRNEWEATNHQTIRSSRQVRVAGAAAISSHVQCRTTRVYSREDEQNLKADRATMEQQPFVGFAQEFRAFQMKEKHAGCALNTTTSNESGRDSRPNTRYDSDASTLEQLILHVL